MIYRHTLITVLSVFGLTLFIIFLFLTQKASWQHQLDELRAERDSLLELSQHVELKYHTLINKEQRIDSLRSKALYDNYFDAYDEQNFRLYALYKDTERRFSSKSSLANAFNIENPESIKDSRVMGDMWYIVPIKGVHFVREDEKNWASIAKKYYFNVNDSSLLQKFNKTLQHNRFIIVPFN